MRVHVRQLRLKLHEYFNEDGRNEPIVLEIPKGSYAPVFRAATESRDAFCSNRAESDSSPGMASPSDVAVGSLRCSGHGVRRVGVSSDFAPHYRRGSNSHSSFLAVLPDLRYPASDDHRCGGQQLWDGAYPFQPARIAGSISSPGISPGPGSQQDRCGEFPPERVSFQLDAHFVCGCGGCGGAVPNGGAAADPGAGALPEGLEDARPGPQQFRFYRQPGVESLGDAAPGQAQLPRDGRAWWETAPRYL